MALALLPIILITLFFILLTHKLYKNLKYNLPPGPYPWPIIGNLHQMEPDRSKSYEKWSKKYGDIISIWFGSTLDVIVSSPKLAKEVLKDKDQHFANRYRGKFLDVLTKNGKDLVWADYGPHYVKLRRICNFELFSSKSIEGLRPIREFEVRSMIESIYLDWTNHDHSNRDGSNNNFLLLRKYLENVALNTITRMVLGKRFLTQSGELNEQGMEIKALVNNETKQGSTLGLFEHIWCLSWIFKVTNTINGDALSEHMTRRYRLIQAMIDEHKAAVCSSAATNSMKSFVDVLIGLQEKDDISQDTMAALLWDMIAAGMDTIAITVEWAMAELVKNQNVQNKVQEELEKVIGSSRVLTESDIPNLPYLQCVVKESLRLHPPTPLMLPHKTVSDHSKIGGFAIPKGTTIHVNVKAIAQDPLVWSPDPQVFRPERFIAEDVDMKGHDFRLLPFGSGRRMCPASQLSVSLVSLMIGSLLHHYKWAPFRDIDLSGTPSVVNYMKSPLQAIPYLRIPAHLCKLE